MLTREAWYETMTSTGYKDVVFTEINPTSTTTTISGILCFARGALTAGITMGPFTVISHEAEVSSAAPTTNPSRPAASTATSTLSCEFFDVFTSQKQSFL